MIKYAIVGNIASGKSEFEKILDKHGFVVLDTDLMAHDILMDKPDIPKAFADYDVFEYGRLSREKLGKLVFNNNDLKQKLEGIIHPLIKEELETAFNVYSEENVIFITVPLLFEVGWENLFDKIIFIQCDDKLRLERLMERNGYTKEYAQTRLNSQLPQDEKAKKSDYIIENNGSKEEFKIKAEEFIESICS